MHLPSRSLYLYPLRIVDEAGEDDDAEDEEEDQQHQLLGGGSECLQEDLEAAGVAGEFEQPEDPDDAEELEDVRVLDVGDEVLEDEVGVEADGGHEVNDIDGGLEKITFVRTTEKPVNSGRCTILEESPGGGVNMSLLLFTDIYSEIISISISQFISFLI